jgi:uncharacterized protein YkwD
MNIFLRSLAAALAICTAFAAQTALAQQKADAAARQLFEAVNHERASQGLAQLKWDDALAKAAHQHAEAMAGQNTLSHQLPGEVSLPARVGRAGVQFISLSENVAQGPTAANIYEQWKNSPNHRANILDSDMDTVGIGIAERNGVLFAAADFCKARR